MGRVSAVRIKWERWSDVGQGKRGDGMTIALLQKVCQCDGDVGNWYEMWEIMVRRSILWEIWEYKWNELVWHGSC